MIPRSILGLAFALAAAVGGPAPLSRDPGESIRQFGLDPFPGAVAAPELSTRLEPLRNIRWIAAGVFLADAPLAPILARLRSEQSRLETSGGAGSPASARLREWLEKNPDQMTRYREFEGRERASAGPAQWEISTIPASEIPLGLGGGEPYRAPRFAARRVQIAFGTILLPDAVVRVQLLSPHPSADGKDLASGTLIALIREANDSPAVSPAVAETVDGPETPGLASRLGGWLVMDQPVGGMVALSVPGLERRTVRPAGQTQGVVHTSFRPRQRWPHRLHREPRGGGAPRAEGHPRGRDGRRGRVLPSGRGVLRIRGGKLSRSFAPRSARRFRGKSFRDSRRIGRRSRFGSARSRSGTSGRRPDARWTSSRWTGA